MPSDTEVASTIAELRQRVHELRAELEQAERERDEALERVQTRIEESSIYRVYDEAMARAQAAEARLAKVPALVEALRPFTEWDFDQEPSPPLPEITRLVFREDQQRARDALAVWEQE